MQHSGQFLSFAMYVGGVYLPSLPRMDLNTLRGKLSSSAQLWEEPERCWFLSPVLPSSLPWSPCCASFLVCSELLLAFPSDRPYALSSPWVTASSQLLSFALTGEWYLEGAQDSHTAVLCSQLSVGLTSLSSTPCVAHEFKASLILSLCKLLCVGVYMIVCLHRIPEFYCDMLSHVFSYQSSLE